MNLHDWLTTYLSVLPPPIRGSTEDVRLTAAARRARENGWAPRHAATVVAGRNYGGTTNPQLVAILRLEELAQHPPELPRPRGKAMHPNGCIVCPPHAQCDDPVLHRIPDQWAAERMALIRRLMHTPGELMDDDAREQGMTDLIAEQHRRGA